MPKKSNILHVRLPYITRNMVLLRVAQYKYLGIVITECIDYKVVVHIVADAANRALSSVINKYKKNNGFGYYTILSHSVVQLIVFLIMPVKCGDIGILHK